MGSAEIVRRKRVVWEEREEYREKRKEGIM
jgi:hypothetical protein